jgi:pimeloyl-ACP methyl ester carboxylesterase
VGLAGFSMGGLVGLELLSRFPERFGAYCGIQIAIKERDASRYARILERAFENKLHAHDAGRPIRVVTATRDTYRWSNVAFFSALERRHLDASLELRRGEHSSEWMRKAGSFESLLWLDQTLNGRFNAGAGL